MVLGLLQTEYGFEPHQRLLLCPSFTIVTPGPETCRLSFLAFFIKSYTATASKYIVFLTEVILVSLEQ